MKSKTISAAAIGAALLLAHPASAAGVNGDPVLYWNQLLIQSLPASPIFAARHAAILNTAMHDAVNAAQGAPNRGYLGAANPNGGDTRAAASAAAYTVLKALYPANAAIYDAAYANSLALVADGAAKTAGIASGQAYANQMLALRVNDGWNATVAYTPSGLVGRWAPTPGAFLPAAAPQWGDVTPFLMTSTEQFRAAPPPSLTSAEYTAAFNQVKDIGSATSLTRTADQSAAATYWVAASGPAPWIQMAINSAEGQGTSVMQNATIMARLSDSIMDSTIAIFDSKYAYDYWRPVTAIRQADLDNNPLTDVDPNWTPFITTPNHPSYVSGHSAIAGAGASILADAFGDSQQLCLTWGGANRCWANFTAIGQEAANSRLWGGIHWSFDNEAGLLMGRQIASYTLGAREFGAVPEPATWGLLVVGFGMIGAGKRRQRRAHTLLTA